MAGLLSFHAHPDDEVTSTGGTLAKYAAAGEQVVVVTATDGAEGEVHNYDNPDEIKPRLVEIRREEMAASLQVLGVEHHHFLGYRDSGMMGSAPNSHPDCFWQADFEEAVGRLVALIRRYQPEVMTIYDPYGGYGHPDHIMVHRVGMAAFFGSRDLRRFPLEDGQPERRAAKLYMSSWSRSRVRRMVDDWVKQGRMTEEEAKQAREAGAPDEEISTTLDVLPWVRRKVEAARAHRTQIPDDWFMLRVPEEEWPQALGTETFQRVFSTVEAPFREDDLFAGLR